MSQRRRRAVAAVVTGGVLIGTACASAVKRTTPPIRVATPRISASRMSVAPAEADGLTRFGDWPKACDLLVAADVRAVLPQVTKIVQTPHEQKITVTNLGDGGGDDHDVPESACETRFWVTGTERRRPAEPDVIRVEDIAVGDSATVKDNYDALVRSRPRTPSDLGSLECVLDGGDYYCRTPHVAFSVGTGHSLHIDSFVGQPKKVEAWAYWVHDVLPAFVRSVASKLPRR